MLSARPVENEKELDAILSLQQKNLRGKHDQEVERSQGFVTVTHSREKLLALHKLHPSIVVMDGHLLAGYALVMLQDAAALIPELYSLFAKLHRLLYKGKPVNEYRYYVMGQVCVDEAYRGTGVFDLLYEGHQRAMGGTYELVITEIATRNTRSRRAHERVGFETIEIYTDEMDEWAVVAWQIG